MSSPLFGLAFKAPMCYRQHMFTTLGKRILNGTLFSCFCLSLRLPKAKDQIKTSGKCSATPKLVSCPLALKICL